MSLVNNFIPGIDQTLPLMNPGIWLYLPKMQCNFRCSYCYMNRAANPRGNNSHSNKFKLPKNIGSIKGWIILYGGEPFTDKKLLHSLILEIRKYTSNPISFSTNGSLLTYKDVNFLSKNNVHISISYDGPNQKYRGKDIFKTKYNILKKAYKKGIIYGINTVVHNKNFNSYTFDIPGFKLIHDYNFIYPLETPTNKSFLLPETLADTIANNVVNCIKSLLLDIKNYSAKALALKYPPFLFTVLESMLQIYTYPKSKKLNSESSLCVQIGCKHFDIYGNEICGKGIEGSKQNIPLNENCVNCKFVSVCDFKCPIYNFDRTTCKNNYMYKIYEKVYNMISQLAEYTTD